MADFQREHYEALAKAIGEGDARKLGLGGVVHSIRIMLTQDNPNFDYERFRAAISAGFNAATVTRGKR